MAFWLRCQASRSAPSADGQLPAEGAQTHGATAGADQRCRAPNAGRFTASAPVASRRKRRDSACDASELINRILLSSELRARTFECTKELLPGQARGSSHFRRTIHKLS